MHAAEHGHQQGVTGVLPAQIVGIDALQHEGQQGAAKADEGAGEDQRAVPEAVDVVAEAAGTLLIVPDRL